MSRERRRTGGMWSLVVDDPYRKLVAIGLAVLLWFFIDSRITKTHERTLPLVVVGPTEIAVAKYDRLAIELPTDRVRERRFLDGDQEIKNVEVVLTGPRFLIDAIESEPLDLAVTAFMVRNWGRQDGEIERRSEFVEFTAQDIRRDLRALRDVRMELRPARVRLEVERYDNLNVPLPAEGLVEIVDGQLGDRLLRDTARYTPSEVKIVGPVAGIAERKRRPPPLFRVVINASGNERQVRAPLELIGGDELGLRLETQPYLTISLRPQSDTFTFELPIVVDDLALTPEQRGRYQPELPTRSVRVSVAGSLRSTLLLKKDEDGGQRRLQDWAAENLRLQVTIPKPLGGQLYGAELDRQAWLVPVGSLLEKVDRAEYRLEDPVVVKLRQKT